MKNQTVVSYIKLISLLMLAALLSACGFQAQGKVTLAQPLSKLSLEIPDPYGHLARNLKLNLSMSNVILTPRDKATTILRILADRENQELLSVSGTQQTRQYRLILTVVFDITDKNGLIIVPSQSVSESRNITVQANKILGSSNEATLYYQQMRRSAAYAIMNRLGSKEITRTINHAFKETHHNKK